MTIKSPIHGWAVMETDAVGFRTDRIAAIFPTIQEARAYAKTGALLYSEPSPISLRLVEGTTGIKVEFIHGGLFPDINFPEIKEEARKRALDKLTKEEQALLGF